MKKISCLLVALVISAAVLAGCKSLPQRLEDANPIAVGCSDLKQETALLCGYSMYGTWLGAQRTALKIFEDAPPASALRTRIAQADDAVKPIADRMFDALVAYETIRLELAAGKTTQDKVDIANANVLTWIEKLRPLLLSFKKTIASK